MRPHPLESYKLGPSLLNLPDRVTACWPLCFIHTAYGSYKAVYPRISGAMADALASKAMVSGFESREIHHTDFDGGDPNDLE